jgi:hypothetical protein
MKKLPILMLIATLPMSLAAYAAHAVVEINVRPPEPRVVVVPAERHGYAYAPGYWRWNGHKHVWVDGRYLKEKHGKHWVAAHWEEGRHGYYHLEEGHWEH